PGRAAPGNTPGPGRVRQHVLANCLVRSRRAPGIRDCRRRLVPDACLRGRTLGTLFFVEKMLESMARAELIAGKPSPDEFEVVQQNLQRTLFPFSDEVVANEHGGAEEDLDVLPVH